MEIKNRQKTLLLVAGAGLLLLIGDSFILTPLTNSWKDRAKQIADLRTQVTEGARLVKRERVDHGNWENMRTNMLPADVSLAEGEMLKAFDRWERTSGITRVSIKPQWKQTDDDYATLECRADYTGDMRRLSSFLYEMEKDPISLKIENVEISSRDNDGTQLSLGIQVSSVRLTPLPE